MSLKRKMSVDVNDVWHEFGVGLEDLKNKRSKSEDEVSPSTSSSPSPGTIEVAELSPTLQTSDDSSFVDLTLSPTLLSSNPRSNSTDHITTENHFLSVDTLPGDLLSLGSPEVLQSSISIMCTIKFNDLYYFDMQVPPYHPDHFFDLTQDPERWAHMCIVSPHNEHEDSPNRYIDHCLNLMWNKNGNCRDILGVLVFAWFLVDKEDTWNFWDRLWRLAMNRIVFKDESGRSISYLGRVDLPGGLRRACWNHALQEFLEDEGYWGSSALFTVDERNGLRWIKPTAEEEEHMTNSDSFAENWMIELPRNEYYW